MRALRAFQASVKGPNTTLSPRSRATAMPVTMTSTCCRFLIGISRSFIPNEAKAELQRRRLSASGAQVGIAHLRIAAQLLNSLQQCLVIARGPCAGHQVQVADFNRFSGHAAVFREGLREVAQDG